MSDSQPATASRGRLSMTPKNKASLKNISIALGAVLAAFSVVTGATHFVSSAIGVVDRRYVQRDSFSVYQAGQAARDHELTMDNARRDSLLQRVDERVGAMYCGSLPPGKRAGCR